MVSHRQGRWIAVPTEPPAIIVNPRSSTEAMIIIREQDPCRRTGTRLATLPLLLAFLGACSSSAPDPATDPDTAGAPAEHADVIDTFAVTGVPDSLLAPPLEELDDLHDNESLHQKILRSHPQLVDLQDLYDEGSLRYVDGELDLAEEYFYLLQESVEEASADQPDSLALLYLGSLDRKLSSYIEIISEERFFSESYAPYSESLTEAYDSLRTRYDVPEILMPRIEPSTFERELLLVDRAEVDWWIDYFTGRGRKTYQRWLERKAEYGWVIEEILVAEEMPPDLIYMAMIESGLSTTARSRAAAVGPWQFVSSTARLRGLRVDSWVDERRDLEKSTIAACRHLKLLYGMFQNWPLAFAAYNAGEYRIQRAIGLQGDPDYWHLRLPRETREYVPKYIAAARIGRAPEAFGFMPAEVDTLRFDHIMVDDTFSLDQVAKAGQFPVRDLTRLNPHLLAGCTPPNTREYSLRVPDGRGETTSVAVRKIPEGERIAWRKHRIQAGETLGGIARRYRTSAQAIMDLNGIRNPRRVRAGTELTIPYPRVVQVSTASARSAPGGNYVVRRGDTLSGIARAHGVTVTSLRQANGLSGNRIVAGSTLKIPGSAAVDVDTSTHEQTTYQVRPGDTLYDISRAESVSLDQLMKWNQLSPGSTIRPGDELVIWRRRSG
jgi:membrane-bound lytic murein transglycosylase D